MNEAQKQVLVEAVREAASAEPLFYLLAACLLVLVGLFAWFISRSQKGFLVHLEGRDERDEKRTESISVMARDCHKHSLDMMTMAHDTSAKCAEAANACARALQTERTGGLGS